MKNLLYKELKLVTHPTNIIFLSFVFMMLIPSYPYYVNFFYTTLGIFFACLGGRENNDIIFTAMLPVRKRDIVGARILFVSLLEMAQLLLAVPFAMLRASLTDGTGPNAAGMDANIALFGLSFVLFGVFNLVFFTKFYKNPDKVGKAFAWSATAVFAYILVAEACVFAVPFFRDRLDTPDPAFLKEKIAVLLLGAAVFALLTFITYKRSAAIFEKNDL